MLPGVRIILREDNSREVEELEEMGEMKIASSSVLRGYIDHGSEALLPPASNEGFSWPTGHVGFFRVAPRGETPSIYRRPDTRHD